MDFFTIASSSKGNATVVTHGQEALLIDCGVTRKLILESFESRNFDPSCIKGVLITHDHTDHISGLATFLNKFDVPVFANALTAEVIAKKLHLDISSFIIFENSQEFDFGSFNICPFSIPHDTPDPVGFLITASGITYFHGTDIGTPLDSIGQMFNKAHLATLESNHDLEMLFASGRQMSLIKRICGPRGHLSNEEAAELVKRFASKELKKIFLAHLSDDCNDPTLAEKTMARALRDIGREDIHICLKISV
ncbi:MAG: MBL fold metallo-hydrolase [Kiritimatiellae bacterium]|nr:MBL fold metallo-hydrolase [Kiritimatiellia bacterium]